MAKINGNPRKRLVTFLPGDGRPLYSQKTGRNNLCRCGSGLKAKKCCGAETKLFKRKNSEDGIKQENN